MSWRESPFFAAQFVQPNRVTEEEAAIASSKGRGPTKKVVCLQREKGAKLPEKRNLKAMMGKVVCADQKTIR